ncbi:MAG: Maf family protein [Candidatus Promineifilaceae bacterium]|nr:Maf family protein [Candidatus Promineifilaceae bacterium]
MVRFILASASPRRQALIQLLQRPVEVCVADVDESSVSDPDPAVDVVETARLKAEAVAQELVEPALIVAADTTVALHGEILNKPASPAAARRMLNRLRSHTHHVHTGLVLLDTERGQIQQTVSTTAVTMRNYSEEEVAAYVATGDPMDKAGAYAIQHRGFRPVARLDGCYSGVVGLSLCRLSEALAKMGVVVNLPVATEQHDYRNCTTCLALLDGLLF